MKLTHELRDDHLLVCVEGAFESRVARGGLGLILAECQARGVRRVLIDGRGITNIVSIADRYELATQLAQDSHGKLRIAVVVTPENLFTKTLEDTATNRGLKLKTTASIEDAHKFLELES